MSAPLPVKRCGCGSTWFRLRKNRYAGAGVVRVGENDEIVGYSGVLVCSRCGTELDAQNDATAPGYQLRVVR